VKVLVTGADGFVGRFLLRRLLAEGHQVVGAVRGGRPHGDAGLGEAERNAVSWVPLELDGTAPMDQLTAAPVDAVVHLAAVASSSEARRDPASAWTVNAVGTARLLDALARARGEGRADPLVLVVSSSEVYGAGEGERLRLETDPVRPQSPYGASKAAAEIAALEAWRRTGLKVVVARAFQHTGPGQTLTYVVPALARRIRDAKRAGQRSVTTGNLEPVRDLSDVRDVVAAYVALLGSAVPGEIYNVCRGEGRRLADIFATLAALIGASVVPEPDPALLRAGDIPHLVGDPGRLHATTGWTPAHTFDQTLQDVVDAQAD
jgi:GDP-4-dehydro-6-deoxy-D-mannose reductase